MNKNNPNWWIGGSLLLLAALVVLFIKGRPDPGKSGGLETHGSASAGETAGPSQTVSDRRRERPERMKTAPRPAAQRPLSRTPNPSTEDCLEALPSSSLEADRVLAAMLLGRRAQEEGLAEKAVPALITSMTTDEAPQVWLVSAQALGKYGAAATVAVPHLLKWFDHQTMRDVAMDALAEIGPAAAPAIDAIAPIATNGQEPFISRRKAIDALVKIGGPDHPAVAALLQSAATDPDPRLRLAATQALKIQAASELPAGE